MADAPVINISIRYFVNDEPGRHVRVRALNDLTFEVYQSPAVLRDVEKLRRRLLDEFVAKELVIRGRDDAASVALQIRTFYEKGLKTTSVHLYIEWVDTDEDRRETVRAAAHAMSSASLKDVFGMTREEAAMMGALHWSLGTYGDSEELRRAGLNRERPFGLRQLRDALASDNKELADLADHWVEVQMAKLEGREPMPDGDDAAENRREFIAMLDRHLA